MPESGLETFTTSELINELERRFEAVVCVTFKNLDRSREQTQWFVRGGDTMALGLIEKARHGILKTYGATKTREPDA